jgi:hypothetical protein
VIPVKNKKDEAETSSFLFLPRTNTKFYENLGSSSNGLDIAELQEIEFGQVWQLAKFIK